MRERSIARSTTSFSVKVDVDTSTSWPKGHLKTTGSGLRLQKLLNENTFWRKLRLGWQKLSLVGENHDSPGEDYDPPGENCYCK
jgi:hypothetical protein